MNKMNDSNRLFRWVTAGALGALLAPASAYAANAIKDDSADATQMEIRDFVEVDENNDALLVWAEIQAFYEDELRDLGWSEERIRQEFEMHGNGEVLTPEEYTAFVSRIITTPTTRQAAINERSLEPPEGTDQRSPSQGAQELRVSGDEPNRAITQQGLNRPDSIHQQQRSVSEESQNPPLTTSRDDSQTGDAQQQEAAEQEAGMIEEVASVGDLSVEDIANRAVVNLDGQELGKVKDVVLRKDGVDAGLVVAVSGGTESKQKNIFVSFDQVAAAEDKIVWQTPLDEQDLVGLPEYNEAIYVSVTGP